MECLLAESSDAVQITTMFVGLAGTMFSAWIGYLMFKLKVQGEVAAKAVGEVKETLEHVTDAAADDMADIKSSMKKVGDSESKKLDAIHTLVNSSFGAQLRLHAETARAKANITRDRADVVAAEMAEKLLREHEVKQKIVDDKGTTA